MAFPVGPFGGKDSVSNRIQLGSIEAKPRHLWPISAGYLHGMGVSKAFTRL